MQRDLARVLKLSDLLLIVVGTVIGSGIFLVPGNVLNSAHGDVGVALLIWALGGVLSLLGALSFGELGAMDPEAGGIYVYLRQAHGSLVAFRYGWAGSLLSGGGPLRAPPVTLGPR